MVSFLTGVPRAGRIREIVRILQEEEPGPDPDARIELCRVTLGLMTRASGPVARIPANLTGPRRRGETRKLEARAVRYMIPA